MRRTLWTVVAAAVAGVLVGCSASSPEPEPTCRERDRAAVRAPGTELAVPVRPRSGPPDDLSDHEVEAALPPAKAHPSYEEQALRELMRKTLRMVDAEGEVRPGTCEEHVFEKGEVGDYRCTVRYEDREVAWQVEFFGGSAMMNMRSWLVTGLLTARHVQNAFGRGPQNETRLRCDRMPEIFRAEAGRPTRYRCQSVFTQCFEGRWDGDRRTVLVGVDAQGDVTFFPREK